MENHFFIFHDFLTSFSNKPSYLISTIVFKDRTSLYKLLYNLIQVGYIIVYDFKIEIYYILINRSFEFQTSFKLISSLQQMLK